MNIKEQDELIKLLEDTTKKLSDSEEVITDILELCKSYFLHDYRTEASTMRFNSMITIINKYFDKHEEGDQDGDTGIQSKSN